MLLSSLSPHFWKPQNLWVTQADARYHFLFFFSLWQAGWAFPSSAVAALIDPPPTVFPHFLVTLRFVLFFPQSSSPTYWPPPSSSSTSSSRRRMASSTRGTQTCSSTSSRWGKKGNLLNQKSNFRQKKVVELDMGIGTVIIGTKKDFFV